MEVLEMQLGALIQFALIVGGLGLAYVLFFVIHIVRCTTFSIVRWPLFPHDADAHLSSHSSNVIQDGINICIGQAHVPNHACSSYVS